MILKPFFSIEFYAGVIVLVAIAVKMHELVVSSYIFGCFHTFGLILLRNSANPEDRRVRVARRHFVVLDF